MLLGCASEKGQPDILLFTACPPQGMLPLSLVPAVIPWWHSVAFSLPQIQTQGAM